MWAGYLDERLWVRLQAGYEHRLAYVINVEDGGVVTTLCLESLDKEEGWLIQRRPSGAAAAQPQKKTDNSAGLGRYGMIPSSAVFPTPDATTQDPCHRLGRAAISTLTSSRVTAQPMPGRIGPGAGCAAGRRSRSIDALLLLEPIACPDCASRA